MQESPFLRKKTVLRREPTFWEGSVLRAVDRAGDAFVRAIPSEDVKQLPPRYLYPVGGMVFFVLLGIFTAVFVPGYLTQIRAKFLVPLGSGNSKYCDDVPISNTGTFLATREGIWQGAQNFSFANGSYIFSATNYQATQSDFRDQMTGVYDDLVNVGRYARTQNLGVNLLFWMSWTEVQPGFASQRFTMSGTPLTILNRGITAGTVSNVLSDCDAAATSSFNPGSGELQVTYQVQDFLSNPNCSRVTPPTLFGYKYYVPTDTFSIKFDVRTLITCVALNSMIANPAALQVTAESTFPYKNITYPIASYVDPRYPGMRPVQCLFPGLANNLPFCIMIVGTVYALPIFNHAGSNFTLPLPCNCTEEELKGSNIGTDPYNLCNVFNFLTGFIFYPYELKPEPILDLMFRYPNSTGRTLNELAFTAMFTAGIYGVGSPLRASFDSPAQREAMYAFCHSARYGNCSIVTFNSVDESSSSTDWIVASTYHQVKTGACSDSFSATPEAWEQLVEQPFAPLSQQYQTCSNDPTTALFNQAGVSAGNVSLLSPLGVLLVLGLLAAYQFCSGAHIPRSYSRADKDGALDALAVAMLLVRDRRLGALQKHFRTVNGEERDESQALGSKQLRPPENMIPAEAREAGSAAAAGAARTAAVLADLVEALAEVAAASQQDAALLHKSAQEPVYVDWGHLGARVLGSSGGSSSRTHSTNSTNSSNNSNRAAGKQRKHQPDMHMQSGADVHERAQGRRADSDDDVEMEMPTISKLHHSTDTSSV